METSRIVRKIYKIMNEVLDADKVARGDGDLLEVLDSVEFVTLLVEIETEFDIEIDDSDYELKKMSTVSRIAELVEKYLNRKGISIG